MIADPVSDAAPAHCFSIGGVALAVVCLATLRALYSRDIMSASMSLLFAGIVSVLIMGNSSSAAFDYDYQLLTRKAHRTKHVSFPFAKGCVCDRRTSFGFQQKRVFASLPFLRPDC